MEPILQKTTQDEYTLFFHMEGEKAQRHGYIGYLRADMAAAGGSSTRLGSTASPASKRKCSGTNSTILSIICAMLPSIPWKGLMFFSSIACKPCAASTFP